MCGVTWRDIVGNECVMQLKINGYTGYIDMDMLCGEITKIWREELGMGVEGYKRRSRLKKQRKYCVKERIARKRVNSEMTKDRV